jgi:hypothetical protein
MRIATNVSDRKVCFEDVLLRTASFLDGGTGGC